MALRTYNGTDFDTHLGSATITASVVTLTLAGVTSAGVTAPNTTNKITGVWICVAALPSNGGNITAEIMESGVSKATATINSADIQLGMNYLRYATPYQFTTTGASAYTCRLKNTVGSSGSVRTAASGLWFQFTYDATSAYGSSDDLWVGGFNDAGLTPKTFTISGTTTWGSKATTNIGSTPQTMGAALTIGSGGTAAFDQSASTTLTLKGSVWVTVGGVFDMRPPSNKSIVSTLIIDSTVNGDQGLFSGQAQYGGQILTTGATTDTHVTRGTGVGTAADPWIPGSAIDSVAGDEVVFGGSSAYNNNETRFIKTRNSSTSFVLCSTPGGAEAALANTHDASSYVGLMTRNSIIKPLTTNLGYYVYHSGTTVGSFDYTRFEYSDNTSGKGIILNMNSATSFDGIVLYNNSIAGGRTALFMSQGGTGSQATVAQTHTGIILYNTAGSNFAGQSGVGYSGTSNKTMNYLLHYNASSTTTCATLSLNTSSTGNIFNNCHSYGANAVGSAGGYAIGILSSSGNTFNDCTVNACRLNAVYLWASTGNVFNNCNFGTISSNLYDITTQISTLNQALFNECYFGSTFLITNYLNQLDTSIIAFQDMDGNTSKHRWYTNYGSWWSAGAGLTDTTVRTASSLSLVSKPENNSTGSSWSFKIPAAPTSSVAINGYVYRNATFSSGTLKAELFLPGNTTGTPDVAYTFPTTTGSWLPFSLTTYYSGTVARYATVKITGVTSTAGAYFFVDDLYDAGTNNKVAGLDLWDEGKPSEIMVVTDFSAAVPVIVNSLWNDSNTYAVGTKGKAVIDTESNSDATQAKVDVL